VVDLSLENSDLTALTGTFALSGPVSATNIKSLLQRPG
jgi:hypothetical protein